jgi:hypothetical protein
MFAEARFVKEASSGAVVLPRNTVISNASEDYVYVVRDGAAARTPVALGIDNGRDVEILSGVGFGDFVIVKGHTNISDGDLVNVVNAPAPASAGAPAAGGEADAGDTAGGAAGGAAGTAEPAEPAAPDGAGGTAGSAEGGAR